MDDPVLVKCEQLTDVAPPLSDLYAPVRSDLGEVARIFDEELVSEQPFINALCDTVRSYRGKMLRPAMLLLAGQGGGELSPDHHRLGAVIEMVHMATLVHDDILDEADERRGQPSVNSLSGNVAAVLLGDYLISHAYHLCSSVGDTHAAKRVADATNTVCEGELLQDQHCGDPEVTESLYYDIVRRKTGALTAIAGELGAYYAGADAEVVEAMHSFGMSAGVAFQIVDDVLDLVGDRRKVGKTLGRDLAMGKLTLPTIHGMAHADDETAAILRSAIVGEGSWDAVQLRGRLTEVGSVDYALAAAAAHVDTALAQLVHLKPGKARSSLSAMAEFIVRRHF